MNILVIDVGGTNVKVSVTGRTDPPVKIPSGKTMTAHRMVDEVLTATADWKYDAVSIGFPAPVFDDQVLAEPANLGGGWVGHPFTDHFGKPVKLMNDAAMQALGSYNSGRMLFLGLGTGLGTAMVLDGVVVPLELAHLPYRKGKTYEDYLGLRGLEARGKKKWERSIADVVRRFKAAMVVHEVVLGGGNAKQLETACEGARLGNNSLAFLGGFRMWDPQAKA